MSGGVSPERRVVGQGRDKREREAGEPQQAKHHVFGSDVGRCDGPKRPKEPPRQVGEEPSQRGDDWYERALMNPRWDSFVQCTVMRGWPDRYFERARPMAMIRTNRAVYRAPPNAES